MLPINSVIQVDDKRYRLLWTGSEQAYWINIDNPTAWPELVSIDNLSSQLCASDIYLIEDPFYDVTLRVVKEGTTAWVKRENAWRMIECHIDNMGLFSRRKRGEIIQEIIRENGITHQTAYRILRRYWQRGMCKNALQPDYHNSGAKGRRKGSNGSKLGRPRLIRDGVGSNITPEIERIFRQVIELKLLKETRPVIADAFAYALTIIGAANPNISSINLLTVEQFRYFFKREYDAIEVLQRQVSHTNYAKDIRPILGTSTTESLGPGHRYQIDATIADIYLVSEHDRSLIVGRPVIYMTIDVFSRMVTGLYIGFEGPSWISAMMAIANAVSGKVGYCKQFGINIEEQDWPVYGLPDVILADKGELNGTKVEVFSEAFGVRIENASARRGDAKGIVERQFLTVQEQFKPYFKGVVESQRSRKKGGHDYRQDANLTLNEFTKQILASVLWHNNYHTLLKYDRAERMPADVAAIPIKLWEWGLSNITGRLRQADEELVRINLLPHDSATVSELGIRLFGCYYSCAEALKLGWFHRDRSRRPQKIQVAYDPRSADYIYIRPNDNLMDYWVCRLTDRSRRFRGHTFWDVWQKTKIERKTDGNAALEAIKEKGKLLTQIEGIAKQAKRSSPIEKGLKKKDLGLQIKVNKQLEKDIERKKHAIKPSMIGVANAEIIKLNPQPTEDDYSFPSMTNLIFGEGDNNE